MLTARNIRRLANLSLDATETDQRYWFWLSVTLVFWIIPQTFLIQQIFSKYPFIVQDDARSFVVWLRRLADPAIYPNDPIADYYLATIPWLYKALYWPFVKIGFEPLLVHPLLFVPATAILWSTVCFAFVHRLWPSSAGAAFSTIAMSYVFISGGELGLPKSLEFTGVLLPLLFFLDRRIVLTSVAMFMVAGIYPQAALFAGVAMVLLMLRPRFPFVTQEKSAWLTLLAAGLVTLVGGAIYLAAVTTAGPTITAEEARHLATFGPTGRTKFFYPDIIQFYFCSSRAGLLPFCKSRHDVKILEWALVVILVLGGALWLLATRRAKSLFSAFGLPPPDKQFAPLCSALVMSGLLLFALAHVFAFTLYLPSRYAAMGLELTFALLVAVGFSSSIIAAIRWLFSKDKGTFMSAAVIVTVAVAFLAVSVKVATRIRFETSEAHKIYRWLQETPKNSLVAGFPDEIEYVPAFGYRSIFGGWEFMLPYKRDYFNLISSRMINLADALYTDNPQKFASLANNYGIDYLLVHRSELEALDKLKVWARSLPQLQGRVDWLREGGIPFFRKLVDHCEKVGTTRFALLDVTCMIEEIHVSADQGFGVKH